MVKVSVILPVYNVEKFLRKSLDTIVNQTLKDIEIICIDDGSEDNSLEILNEYSKKDNRIIVISRKHQGTGVARNEGIKFAKGEYLQFVDPDDWITTDALEILYNFAKNNKSQVVRFDYIEHFDYNNEEKKHNFAEIIQEHYGYNLIQTPFYSWRTFKKGFLYKLGFISVNHFYLREFIQNNNIQYAPTSRAEDHIFLFSVELLAEKIDYLGRYFYFYRRHYASQSYKQSDDYFSIFDNIKLLKEFLIKQNLFEELKDEWLEYSKTVILSHYHVPDKNRKLYEEKCKTFFTEINQEKELIEFLKKLRKQKGTFIEKLFSLKNSYYGGKKSKNLCLLGMKFTLK